MIQEEEGSGERKDLVNTEQVELEGNEILK